MEINAKLTNSANAVASTKIDADTIAKKVDDLAKKAAKNLKIDGFRKGKVPVAVVMKRYGVQLEQDAKQEIFKNIIDESIKSVNKKADEVIGEPIFSKYDEKDGNIDVEMEISFRPEVNIDGYEELIPEFSTPRVTKKEIEDEINKILLMVAPLEKSDKTELEKGDFAKFDFKGFVDNEAFEGGEAKDYVLEIGSNQFIPGFEDGMIGLKVGEERDVSVKFPAEYGAKHLAGKDAIFKVKLHEIQCKKPATELDEDMLKRILPGEEKPTKEKVESTIKEQLKNDKLRKKIEEELKPKMADALAEKFNFDLPKSIVEQEINLQFNNAWRSFDEATIEEFKKDQKAIEKKRDEFRAGAEKSVKITFLIDALAKKRGIDVSDQELIQAIYFEAYSNGLDPKAHLEEYRKRGVLPAVKMALIEEKLFNNIFSKNKDDKEGE
ncbi:trigger factor [Campylobacter sp. VBCF_06 NA8]|uniref:trigger factor n=1 Tax=Campylobacter sp. VBCF_06 NA8 TaxID=2983822 RepID=UPI0022E9FCEF|nr:trigger factor [Campylobacter sp. VBCF_06 NA8]MDA3045788.1 trigger factor [Campylobacter sp. VBCF_06 NA8]